MGSRRMGFEADYFSFIKHLKSEYYGYLWKQVKQNYKCLYTEKYTEWHEEARLGLIAFQPRLQIHDCDNYAK